MRQRLLLSCVVLGLVLLAACGAPRPTGPAGAVQDFADALVKEDYDAAATFWLPKEGEPEEARRLLVELRSTLIRDYGKLQRAEVRDYDEAKGSVVIIWRLERADVAMAWAAQQTDAGVRVAWSPFFGTQPGRLNAQGTLVPLTPTPSATPNQTELAVTASRATLDASATAEWATSFVERTATSAAIDANATTTAAPGATAAAIATATQFARPPQTFLTARQALLRSQVRARARAWQSDALLIRAGFFDEPGKSRRAQRDQEIALDGTSRVWTFLFASPGTQKTNSYVVEDGAIMEETGNDAATYKTYFAGKGEPFDIDLEHSLDSDQIATIGRENKAAPDNVYNFDLALMINPEDQLLPKPPAQWQVWVRGLFGYSTMYIDSTNGAIVKSGFGPTGSPGTIPTPIAPPGSEGTSSGATPPVTSPAGGAMPTTAAATTTSAKEVFLTARQALVRAQVRARARAWQPDALLIRVGFHNEPAQTRIKPRDQEIRLDGTSRVWTFLFASPSAQQTNAFIVEDGVVVEETGNDAAAYKIYFAAKGKPFDVDLEHGLDSDQIATIGRENKAQPGDAFAFDLALIIDPNQQLLPKPPAQWLIWVRNLLGASKMYIDSADGTILKSDFGPTGSPGTLPTPIAPTGSEGTSSGAAPSAADRSSGATPTAMSAFSPEGAQTATALAATPANRTTLASFLAFLAKRGTPINPADVLVDGDYARSIMQNEYGDTGTNFWKRKGDTWELLTFGTFFPPETLTQLGIPETLW